MNIHICGAFLLLKWNNRVGFFRSAAFGQIQLCDARCFLDVFGPMCCSAGVRPEAAGQLDGEARTNSELSGRLQQADQRVCGRLRQQGELLHAIG